MLARPAPIAAVECTELLHHIQDVLRLILGLEAVYPNKV
jgi:hypothetical protein